MTEDNMAIDLSKEIESGNIKLDDTSKKSLFANKDLVGLVEALLTNKRLANKEAETYRTKQEKLSAELKAIADAKKAQEEQALVEQGKFKELYDKQTAELEQERTINKQITIDNALALKATQKGILKTDYLKLLDKSKLLINDKNEVEGLDDVFDNFYKENQNLFKAEATNTNQTAMVDSSLPPQASAGSQNGSVGNIVMTASMKESQERLNRMFGS